MTPAAEYLYTVRVRVRIPERADTYFDLTNLLGASEDFVVGYATQLSTECFGLPLRLLEIGVISRKPIIDCHQEP